MGKIETVRCKAKRFEIDNLNETKLLNFYSLVELTFKIARQDAITSSKLNELASEGWLLSHVVSGVEGDAGKDDGNGIFITRYIFSKTL